PAREVEPRVVERREVVDRRGHVLERGRPAAALPAPDAPVLDVPGGESAPREVDACGLRGALRVASAPVAAVQHDDYRERPGLVRGVQVRPRPAMRSIAVTLGPSKEVEPDASGRRHARTV